MVAVIVSDTHGDRSFIEKIISAYPNADFYIHAGDSCLKEYELNPFLCVRGNCDYDINHISRIIKLGNHRMFVFHGDRHSLRTDDLIKLSKENNCDIIVHGHTHMALYKCIEGIHILCPGSITNPRGGYPSYAVVTETPEIVVEIKKYGH